MKNKVLFALIVLLGAFGTSKGQTIPNFDFENWARDTNYLNLAITSPATLDTAISDNPLSWTTSNQVTAGKVFHNKILVTQNFIARSGASSIRLSSDSVTAALTGVPVVGTLTLDFVCPGFAVCGRFPINLSAFANLSGTFNPALLPGAGIPVSGRKAKIGGYVQYTPVGGDTAYIVAILRKGSTVVAEAKFLHPDNDAGFVYFEAPFTYYNCIEPDTLVYTVSSGNPYGISGVITGGSTGLHVGSALNVDSIFLIDTLVGFSVPPFVLDDTASTLKNTPVTVPVTVNDNSCSGGALAVSVFAQPLHGTAVVSLNSITYTPNTGYVGLDTFYYTATVGGSPASPPAAGRMKVLAPAGVLDITEGQTKVYPNPAKDKLYITTTNPAVANVSVYDVLGNLVSANAISSNLTIDLSGVTEGVYLIRFTGNEGKVISSSRFSVVK